MTEPTIPALAGITKMTLLEMNNVHFDKRHTLLTPEILASLQAAGEEK